MARMMKSGRKKMYRATPKRHNNRIKQLFMAKGLTARDSGNIADHESSPVAGLYRIVLNCESKNAGAEQRRKITVGFPTD
jgi:hypothetical protein